MGLSIKFLATQLASTILFTFDATSRANGRSEVRKLKGKRKGTMARRWLAMIRTIQSRIIAIFQPFRAAISFDLIDSRHPASLFLLLAPAYSARVYT